MKSSTACEFRSDSAQNSDRNPTKIWAESDTIPVSEGSGVSRFPQLGLIPPGKLAETLALDRVSLRGVAAYRYLCDRLGDDQPGLSTFYEWRPFALVSPTRARYDPVDLLYLEVFGLHLAAWGSREEAAIAVLELFKWQEQMQEERGLHPIDSARALGQLMIELNLTIDQAVKGIDGNDRPSN